MNSQINLKWITPGDPSGTFSVVIYGIFYFQKLLLVFQQMFIIRSINKVLLKERFLGFLQDSLVLFLLKLFLGYFRKFLLGFVLAFLQKFLLEFLKNSGNFRKNS